MVRGRQRERRRREKKRRKRECDPSRRMCDTMPCHAMPCHRGGSVRRCTLRQGNAISCDLSTSKQDPQLRASKGAASVRDESPEGSDPRARTDAPRPNSVLSLHSCANLCAPLRNNARSWCTGPLPRRKLFSRRLLLARNFSFIYTFYYVRRKVTAKRISIF